MMGEREADRKGGERGRDKDRPRKGRREGEASRQTAFSRFNK